MRRFLGRQAVELPPLSSPIRDDSVEWLERLPKRGGLPQTCYQPNTSELTKTKEIVFIALLL